MSYFVKTEDGKMVEVKGSNVRGVDYFDGEVKDFSDKERSFVAVANAETEDRLGDIIMQDGWQLKNYRKNPVVMPFHVYSKLPVGRSLEEFVDEKKKVKRLMFRPQFASYDEADLMYNLYRDKYLKGFSVGFIPLESEDIKPPDDDKEKKFLWRTPQRFVKSELLEVSVAPIPAHPDALSDVKSYVQKGSLYIPSRYLVEDGVVELEIHGEWIHALVADEGEFVKLYEVTKRVEDLDFDLVIVFGLKKDSKTEYYPVKYIVSDKDCETEFFQEWVSSDAKKELDIVLEEQKSDDPPALRIYAAEKYTTDESTEHTGFKLLEEDQFKSKEEDEEEFDVVDEEDKDILGLPDDAEFIEKEEVEERPYPNEHACRLKDPGDYEKFARKNCYQKSDGKCIDYIFGVKDGKSEVQALRYPKKIWSASDAKSHCSSKGGTFEAAASKEYDEALEEAYENLTEVIEAFSDTVKGITDIIQQLSLKMEALFETLGLGEETLREEEEEDADSNSEEMSIIEIVEESVDETEEEGVLEIDGVEDKTSFKNMLTDSIKSALGKL